MQPLPWDPVDAARRNWRDHGWEAAADRMAAVTSIMRVQQLLLARIDTALKTYGVSFARFEMLRLLAFARDRRLSMSRARDWLQVHPTSVTSIVDRLQADGLVRRLPSPDDGRVTLVELTTAGADLVEKATATLNAEIFEPLDLDEADVATLTAILTGFRRRAGDFDPSGEDIGPG